MKNYFLTTLVSAGLLLGSLPTAVAQKGPARPARQELRTYAQQNILPVVRQQRQKLEAQLSAEDKQQVATYRAQLQELRQRGQALRSSVGQPTPSQGQRPQLTEAQRQQLQQLRADTRAVMLNVAQLAQKYGANITQLAQEVQPQKEKWVADSKTILATYTTPDQQQKLQDAHRRGGRRHANGRNGGGSNFFRPATFLLMSPEASADNNSPSALGAVVYPNPTAATAQLNYTVSKAGPVTVALLDSRGNTLRTVVQQQQQDQGPHTLTIEVGDLPAGTYFYKISTKAGNETKRFVKQ